MTVSGVAVFYLSLAAFAFGGIRAVRASVERKSRDALGIGLAAAGLLGFAAAIAFSIASPHHEMLPF
jgi:hypothetical protein